MLEPDVRRALRYVAPYWRRLALVLGLSVLGTAFSLYVPFLSKSLIDDALLGRNAGALVRIVLAFVALTSANFLLNVVRGIAYTRVSAEVLFDMRLALFAHLQGLSPRFYARTPLGQIESRLNSDVAEIQRVLTDAVPAWIGNILFLVGTVGFLLALDPLLFALSLVLLPASLWALGWYRRRLEREVKVVREHSAALGTFLLETMQAMKLVVSHNAQEREIARFRERNDAYVESMIRTSKLRALAGALPGILLSGGGAAVFLVGGWRVINGAITVGTLVAFVAYQMRLFSPIQGMMALYASLATARVSLRRVHEILDTPPEVVEAPEPIALERARGEVRFEDVTFTFDRTVPVLDQVNLSVRSGERVAIVGTSGVGKSTIADLLARHLDPDRGRVLLDGHDLRTLRLADVRRHVVVVEQDPFVFNATMAENVRFARPGAGDGDVLEALRAAGLADLVARLPKGIDTPVGERGRELSAGERQRLAIARAFLANPAVLVLDEATGSLDPATEAQVVTGYEAVMRGRTTIVITHRLELARRAERIVVLERGRIAEEGTADELLARGAAFTALFAVAQPAR